LKELAIAGNISTKHVSLKNKNKQKLSLILFCCITAKVWFVLERQLLCSNVMLKPAGSVTVGCWTGPYWALLGLNWVFGSWRSTRINATKQKALSWKPQLLQAR